MLKVNNKKHQKNVIGVVLLFLLLTLNIFHTQFSSASTTDLEQVNVSWVSFSKLHINGMPR